METEEEKKLRIQETEDFSKAYDTIFELARKIKSSRQRSILEKAVESAIYDGIYFSNFGYRCDENEKEETMKRALEF